MSDESDPDLGFEAEVLSGANKSDLGELGAAVGGAPAGVVGEEPGGGVSGVDEGLADGVSAAGFSLDEEGVVGEVPDDGAGPSPAFGPALDDGELSTLPRIIGSPSFPLPMITIFEFEDCASASVASNSTPTEVGFGDALTDSPLERCYAVRLDQLAL